MILDSSTPLRCAGNDMVGAGNDGVGGRDDGGCVVRIRIYGMGGFSGWDSREALGVLG